MAALAFPLPLACPRCGAPLSPCSPCPCPAQTRLEAYHGIPRTYFGEDYWGECSREELGRILGLLDTTPWAEAVRREAAPVAEHLLGPIGPDFLYGLPWEQMRRVLVLGAGMGFLAAPMAGLADLVIAQEPVPERALFLAHRARQDGLHNLHPIIAGATALPFAAASFDLVALNGVSQYLGLGGRGGPGLPGLLAAAFRLLKPDGYLFLGTETRFAMGWWLRRRDPSAGGLAGRLPSRLAGAYRRLRRMPFYGRPAAGSQAPRFTPAGYEALVRQAGFDTVELYGCFPGCHEHAAVYPLGAYRERLTTRRIVDHSPRRWARLARAVTDARLLYDKLEAEVILLARKRRAAGPLTRLAGVRTAHTLTQFSTDDKVFSLTFAGGLPVSIAKAGKTPAVAGRLRREFEFLVGVARDHGARLPFTLPRALVEQEQNGRTFFEYEYNHGRPLHHLLSPTPAGVRAFAGAFARVCEAYVDLALRLGDAGGVDEVLDDLGAVHLRDPEMERRIRAACREAKGRGWAARWVHGDLALVNVLVPDRGRMTLIDWEHVAAGLPCLDLMCLLYDTGERTRRLPAAPRGAILAAARAAVGRGFERLGLRPADFALAELLFLARQGRFWYGPARADIGPLLRDYQQGAFTIPRPEALPAPAPTVVAAEAPAGFPALEGGAL